MIYKPSSDEHGIWNITTSSIKYVNAEECELMTWNKKHMKEKRMKWEGKKDTFCACEIMIKETKIKKVSFNVNDILKNKSETYKLESIGWYMLCSW